MGISYNKNLHFIIHKKQDYNSLHHIMILQKNHTIIWTWKSLLKFVLIYFIKNSIKITIKFYVYCNRIQNNKTYMWYIKNKVCGFLLQSTYNSSYFSQICVYKNPLLSSQNSSLWAIPSTSPWSKNNKNSKFKLIMFHD